MESNEQTGLVGFVKENPISVVGGNVILCMVNLVLIVICTFGLPELPSLPSIDYGLGGGKMEFYGINPCILGSAIFSVVFLMVPFFLIRQSSGSCENKNMQEVNKDSPKIDSKLDDFVSQNAKEVFWTSYLLTGLNAVLLIICYCGFPELPSLPSFYYDFGLPEFGIPLLPAVDFGTMEFNGINPCILASAIVTIVLLLAPFVLLGQSNRNCEDVDIEERNKNSLEKENGLVGFVYQHAELVFWTGYVLTGLNAILLIICYCGKPNMSIPNICGIAPFSIVCGAIACMIEC